jgi:hypothetical protein
MDLLTTVTRSAPHSGNAFIPKLHLSGALTRKIE